jgi:multiple sugar transport system permease protein
VRNSAAGARATYPAVPRFGVRLKARLKVRGEGLFLLPATIFLATLALYPFVELIRMSVSQVTVDNIFGDWPFIGAAGVQTVARTADFREAAINSAVYVLLVVGIGLGGGLVSALMLWRGSRVASFALAVMVFSWALPGLISGVAWRFLLDPRGMVDNILGLFHVAPIYWLVDGHLPLVSVALVNAWTVVPFATLVFRAALLDLPQETLAAAAVDGARPWQIVRFIVLPLLRPAILVLGVLALVYAFKSFDFIYIMSFGGPGTASTTLPFLSYRLAFQEYNYSQGASVALITVAIVLVLSFLYLRQVRREERA